MWCLARGAHSSLRACFTISGDYNKVLGYSTHNAFKWTHCALSLLHFRSFDSGVLKILDGTVCNRYYLGVSDSCCTYEWLVLWDEWVFCFDSEIIIDLDGTIDDMKNPTLICRCKYIFRIIFNNLPYIQSILLFLDIYLLETWFQDQTHNSQYSRQLYNKTSCLE